MTCAVTVCVVSKGRPRNVPAMEAMLDELLCVAWIVPEDEVGEYQYAGARCVIGEDGGLAAQRNVALDLAFADNRPCVQLDDDLKPWPHSQPIRFTYDGKTTRPMSVVEAITFVGISMDETGALLGGIAPTTNLFFYSRPVTSAFCPACFTVTLPNPIRFDTALPLKEDYDYTLQHLTAHGSVARCNGVMANFGRYSRSGGCSTFRTPEVEAEACRVLLERWPGHLRPNPRRPNELLLKWKP